MKRTIILISILAIGALGTGVFAQTHPSSTIDTLLPKDMPALPALIYEREQEAQKQIDEIKKTMEENKNIVEKAIEDQKQQIKQSKERAIRQIATPELALSRKDLRPGTKLHVTASTYSFNLGESQIVWYHNNTRIKSGYGNTSYSLTLRDVGTEENIRAVITAPNGKIYDVSKTVRPARIYATWSANAYAPAWYRGKALPEPGSTITVTAVPDFRIGSTPLSSQDIIYEWLVNDAPRSISSGINGRGKNIFSFDSGVSASVEYKVTVRAHDTRNRITTEESFVVRAHQPDLVFYERDPFLGLKHWRAVDTAEAPSGKDLVLQFEPFNISNRYLDKLFYTWRVNNKKLANQSPQSRVFRLVSEVGSAGTQNIDVAYELPKNIFVRGSGRVVINVK